MMSINDMNALLKSIGKLPNEIQEMRTSLDAFILFIKKFDDNFTRLYKLLSAMNDNITSIGRKISEFSDVSKQLITELKELK